MNDPLPDGCHSVLLIGGPDAGKSNFLFRIWIAIDAGGGALSKDGLPSDLAYVRAGAAQLLEGSFAGRTSKEVYERVVVPVRTSADAAPHGRLVVPDLDGEQILAICRNRQWSPAWEELISDRCACLLFVRADSDEVVAPLDWAACFDRYDAVIDPPRPVEELDPEPKEQHPAHETALQLPTQVLLTDWIQFLRRAFTAVVGGSCRPRIGVVVSAWDLVPADQQPLGPFRYLQDNFPLLSQFIEANDDQFEFHVFGVSVVAGDLKNDEEFKASYLNGHPRESGFVVHSLFGGDLQRSPDVALPIAWALRALGEGS